MLSIFITMKLIPRIYDNILTDHLAQNRQMAFVAGSRQVGKTTTCRQLADVYLTWDNEDHRRLILAGPAAVAEASRLDVLAARPPVLVFDELHKYRHWKQFLKGFFDTYEGRVRMVVTGSSRLDVYRRGGDSLMGRYFLYHMHPLSAGELCRQAVPRQPLAHPMPMASEDWEALWRHGGHPEPFSRRSDTFTAKWRALRQHQLLREDIRDMTGIHALGEMEILGRLLAERSGEQLVYSALAKQIKVSENTVRNWIETLCSLHYGFLVRPWFRNLSKALRKEPKWFLHDWATVANEGKRAETLCACHLLKAVQGWNDLGLGAFELRYVRDIQKREVDFLVVRDDEPWFLVEVKSAETRLSPSLLHYRAALGCPHAFQVVMQLAYVDADCFAETRPVAVPARTFLSQLP